MITVFYSLFFMFLDFLCFAFFDNYIFHFLLLYCIFKMISSANFRFLIIPLTCLFIEESVIFGLFGVSGLYLIPIIFFAIRTKNIFYPKSFFLMSLLLSICLLFELLFMKIFILGFQPVLNFEILVLFSNLIILILNQKIFNFGKVKV